jgi:WD40 repeat protein
VFEALSGKEQGKYQGGTKSVEVIALSPDDGFIAAGDNEGVIRVWRIPQEAPVATLRLVPEGAVFGLAFSRDGSLLAACGVDATKRIDYGVVTIWRFPKLVKHVSFVAHRYSAHSLAFGREPNILATAGREEDPGDWNSKVKIWDLGR